VSGFHRDPVAVAEIAIIGQRQYPSLCPREEEKLRELSYARLMEVLDQLRELEFISEEEVELMRGATEPQLVVESVARALKRFDKYYATTHFGRRIDWTDDKSVFPKGRP
jgi:hypothetical protein